MSEVLQNLGAQTINIVFNTIDRFDTVKSSAGLGPLVSLKSRSNNKREQIILNAIQSKNWPQIEKIVSSISSSEVCILIDNVTEKLKLTSNIEIWVEEQSNNYWAQLFFGYRLIKKAWKARGGGLASSVSSRMFEQFWAHLYSSKEVFLKASTLDQHRAEPFAALIIVEMGLGYEKQELWQHFIQLGKRDIKHYVGHSNMLHALCEKWGGSHEEMFDIARVACNNEANGSLMYGLIAMAHIERWLNFSMDDQEEYAKEYFFRDDVVSELNIAFEKFNEIGDVRRTNAYFDVLNKFAFCFYSAGDEKSKDLLKRIGFNATDYPWSYQEEPFLSVFDAGHSFSQALRYAGIGKSQLAKRI